MLQFSSPYYLCLSFCPTLHQISILAAAMTSASLLSQQGPPDGVTVTQVNNNGNGCPTGSLSITTTPDQTIIISQLPDFQVAIGPSIDVQQKTKNCAIHVAVSYPEGYQFMLHQSSYSGYARLDAGVVGHFYTQYFVSSNADNAFSAAADIVGDAFGGEGANYTTDETAINPADLWSACGLSDIANFNNRLALESSDPSLAGELTGDGEDTQIFSLSWRECQ